MMLVYDLRAMQILFHPPADAGSRERRTVTIARLIAMIGEEKRKALPKWKRYYLAHREKVSIAIQNYTTYISRVSLKK